MTDPPEPKSSFDDPIREETAHREHPAGSEDDRPILFVGDVQGCAHELALLLEEAGFVPGSHRLIPLGDLVNRGPDAPGVLELLRETRAEPILGNHERGLLDIMRTGRVHPWARRPEYAYSQLLAAGRWEREMASIARWPLFRVGTDSAGQGWVAVHAGLHPTLTPEETPAQFLTEVRFCDANGNEPENQSKRETHPPPGFLPWFDHYGGDRMVLFGHWAPLGLVRGRRVRGLDTGCVYGRQLSGLWWPDDRLVQVNAARLYYPIRNPTNTPSRT